MSRIGDLISSNIGDSISDHVSDYPKMKMEAVESDNIDDRIAYMIEEVWDAKQDWRVRALAAKILRMSNVPARDWKHEVEAVFNWVRQNVRYTRDVNDIELFQKPIRTIELGIGDCDDLSMLLASLLSSIGYSVNFKVVGIADDQYEHVYVEAGIPPGENKEWTPLDPSRPEPPGWEVPPNMVRVSQTYEVD